jgi:hypothetical protein
MGTFTANLLVRKYRSGVAQPHYCVITGHYVIDSRDLVPKKGLEPPHPCEYMDLNHARLPIPPLRHG